VIFDLEDYVSHVGEEQDPPEKSSGGGWEEKGGAERYIPFSGTGKSYSAGGLPLPNRDEFWKS